MTLPNCYRCGCQPCECHVPVRFDMREAQAAGDAWGFNCGPGALCAVLGVAPDTIRPHLREFKAKRYTNPTMMYAILRAIGLRWTPLKPFVWPRWGLVRIQWAGPWTAPGVPARVAYRHTHWVAAESTPDGTAVFDVNAICVGGWLSFKEWDTMLVPWLLAQVEPEADGKWWTTHRLELEPEECQAAVRLLEQEVLFT